MDTRDFILGPIYFLVILLIGLFIRNSRYKGTVEGTYFIYGLALKLFGAVALGLIYQFYYSSGDTYSFFYGGVAYSKLLLNNPIQAIQFFWNTDDLFVLQRLIELNPFPGSNYILRGSAELLMVRITGLLVTIGLQNYTATALLFAAISFSGLWKLYKAFLHFFPNLKQELAIAVFFLPSVVFWGSGILKDTIVVGAIGWVVYSTFQIFIRGRLSLKYALVIIVGLYVMGSIKGYVLIAFFPAILFWLAMTYSSKLPSGFLRLLALPVFGVLLGIVALVVLTRFSEYFGRYELDQLEQTAQSTQWWHTVVNEQGAVYSLGEISYTPLGLLSKVPAAINVSLFRPYIWEANGIVGLLSAIESLALLLLTIRLIIRAKWRGLRKGLQNPFTAFCLIFALVVAFAVGLTSYNFGALVRYKIPLMPFYVGALFMMGYLARNEKAPISRGS